MIQTIYLSNYQKNKSAFSGVVQMNNVSEGSKHKVHSPYSSCYPVTWLKSYGNSRCSQNNLEHIKYAKNYYNVKKIASRLSANFSP